MENPFITNKDKIIKQINTRYDEEMTEEIARHQAVLKQSGQTEAEKALHDQNLKQIEILRNEAISKAEQKL